MRLKTKLGGFSNDGQAAIGKYSWIRVVDVMTKDPLTITPFDSVGQADELMWEDKIRQLPVITGEELVGIITDRDIRSFLSSSLMVSPAAREKTLHTNVGDLMTTRPAHTFPGR